MDLDDVPAAAAAGDLVTAERLVSRHFAHLRSISGRLALILATVDVGADPLKLQPADGRMWVRTADAYVAIDAAANEVVASLAKADVGPAANRNFAVAGAMWICDGRRLHRYDTATLQPVTAIDLDLECDFVYAADDLVVAWNDNDDPGESGESAAVFVDPATNQCCRRSAFPSTSGGRPCSRTPCSSVAT